MTDEPAWRASGAARFQAAAIPVLATPIVSALVATWSWKIDGQQHLDALHHARLNGHYGLYTRWLDRRFGTEFDDYPAAQSRQ